MKKMTAYAGLLFLTLTPMAHAEDRKVFLGDPNKCGTSITVTHTDPVTGTTRVIICSPVA